MSPKDPSASPPEDPEMDWTLISDLAAKSDLAKDDMDQLLGVLRNFDVDGEDQLEHLKNLVKVTTRSLFVKDDDLRKVKQKHEEVKKENKDLGKQVKKLKKMMTGDGDQTLEVLYILYHICIILKLKHKLNKNLKDTEIKKLALFCLFLDAFLSHEFHDSQF